MKLMEVNFIEREISRSIKFTSINFILKNDEKSNIHLFQFWETGKKWFQSSSVFSWGTTFDMLNFG